MLFNSYIFLFAFLPVVLVLWYQRALPLRVRLFVLTAASYIFYGYWDWRFVFLMIASTVVDFIAGDEIHKATSLAKRRTWLIASLGANLGLLGFFKYAGFFARSVNAIAGDGAMPIIDVVLPVGISFYTFQSMSYSIDIYRKNAKPTNDFMTFAAYVSMFPQLVAGPIVRYTEVEEQLRQIRVRPTADEVSVGIYFFVIGLAKKLLIADAVANRINPLLADPAGLEFFTSWLAMLGYTVQIYFDFSGYSDMAVGLGALLGFKFPQNFDSPYKSKDISEFWRRWHMTLSFWLRDYLYISLGGSRAGKTKTLRNLLITMFLGGLWHGAAWTFVVWGLWHGVLLVIHQLWRGAGMKLPKPIAVGVTFIAVVIGWVFFRADTFADAGNIFAAMVGLQGVLLKNLVIQKTLAAAVTISLGVAFFLPNSWELKPKSSRLFAFASAAVFVFCVMRLGIASPFLYFQF